MTKCDFELCPGYSYALEQFVLSALSLAIFPRWRSIKKYKGENYSLRLFPPRGDFHLSL